MITVHLEGDCLLPHLLDDDTNQIEEPITPLDAIRFYWSGGTIEFQHTADGSIPALITRQVYAFSCAAGT